MGTVYLALDVLENTQVAVKVLSAAAMQSSIARLRLKQEIDILSRLDSPYIARLYGTGTLPDNSPYLVMEYLEGRDLKAELRARGPLPVAEAVAYVIQACRGIALAHHAHIVHRDLKPHNLYLTNLDGARQLKVLDFGVAKILDASVDLNLTTTDTVIGTPLYLCPEQLLDAKAISPLGDIWALGVILYELLAGFAPFSDDTAGAVIAAITLDDPFPIDKLRSEIPSGLASVIEQCLIKVPANRIASVEELERRLLPYSMQPDRITVATTSATATKLHIERPERHHGELDLRLVIKKSVDDSQDRLRETLRCVRAARSIDSPPPVERLSLLPDIRHVSSRVRSAQSNSQNLGRGLLVQSGSPEGPSNRRHLAGRLALGASLAFVVVATAGFMLSRRLSRADASIQAAPSSSRTSSPSTGAKPSSDPALQARESIEAEHDQLAAGAPSVSATALQIQPQKAVGRRGKGNSNPTAPPDNGATGRIPLHL